MNEDGVRKVNSFGARQKLRVAGRDYQIYSLRVLEEAGYQLARLPYCLRILLENLLRHEDGYRVTRDDVEFLARWKFGGNAEREIAFFPARVILQDFTGVPAVVDLAAMRDAMSEREGEPDRINPLQPVELVIDHSIQVDTFGHPDALIANTAREFERNRERYSFLRWGQESLRNFRVVPPGAGIVHQVNLEYLARVVFAGEGEPGEDGVPQAYPDTLVGTDSHTTMINGLGILGWGVGGIEAEAAMLGQPLPMLIPPVVGVRLSGRLREGTTATDLVLRVTELLRGHGVVGKFVEFTGPGLAQLPLADRATISNMSPEYGATCGIFPIDAETINYLRLSGRDDDHVDVVEAYLREQGMFYSDAIPEPAYAELLDLDLDSIEPSLAGPTRPQDRIPLRHASSSFRHVLTDQISPDVAASDDLSSHKSAVQITVGDSEVPLHHGSVVIAAITSCTNTSNPSVMLAAGLLARKAVERGLETRPWVKTSLAPGSQVVTEYLKRSGLLPYLEQLRFHIVGYGCTTCIGNSGPLPEPVARGVEAGDLLVCSVLSGNRNFEARVHPAVRANYLMSPPLVVAYALAGRIDIELEREALGFDRNDEPVYLRDLWPSPHEVQAVIDEHVEASMFYKAYRGVFRGEERWNALPVPSGERFAWDDASTYVRRPPYFDDMPEEPPHWMDDIVDARVLVVLGDSVTTDHISPAGNIAPDSPAARYLREHGVEPRDFNSYGSRRGNHEVMMRGTFANVRLRNQLLPDSEGGVTEHFPTGEQLSIFDAAMRYREEGTPLVVLAGREYGSGSSRDWAAKGPRLLGVQAVIAESYERIHRSNLVGMGILPLEFPPGQSAASLGLTGREIYELCDVVEAIAACGDGPVGAALIQIKVREEDGTERSFAARVRLDTRTEVEYYRHGGILQYVLRQQLEE